MKISIVDYGMGNIHNKAVDEIWKGDLFQDFRTRLLKNRRNIDICRNCNQGFGSFLPRKFWNQPSSKGTRL